MGCLVDMWEPQVYTLLANYTLTVNPFLFSPPVVIPLLPSAIM